MTLKGPLTLMPQFELAAAAYRLLPMGSHPRVADKRGTYDLFGPVNKLWGGGYDKAMSVFLACLKEFGDFARARCVGSVAPCCTWGIKCVLLGVMLYDAVCRIIGEAVACSKSARHASPSNSHCGDGTTTAACLLSVPLPRDIAEGQQPVFEFPFAIEGDKVSCRAGGSYTLCTLQERLCTPSCRCS